MPGLRGKGVQHELQVEECPNTLSLRETSSGFEPLTQRDVSSALLASLGILKFIEQFEIAGHTSSHLAEIVCALCLADFATDEAVVHSN